MQKYHSYIIMQESIEDDIEELKVLSQKQFDLI